MQPVVPGGAAKRTSDAERLISSHTSQQGVEAQQDTKQPRGTGKQLCESMWMMETGFEGPW